MYKKADNKRFGIGSSDIKAIGDDRRNFVDKTANLSFYTETRRGDTELAEEIVNDLIKSAEASDSVNKTISSKEEQDALKFVEKNAEAYYRAGQLLAMDSIARSIEKSAGRRLSDVEHAARGFGMKAVEGLSSPAGWMAQQSVAPKYWKKKLKPLAEPVALGVGGAAGSMATAGGRKQIGEQLGVASKYWKKKLSSSRFGNINKIAAKYDLTPEEAVAYVQEKGLRTGLKGGLGGAVLGTLAGSGAKSRAIGALIGAPVGYALGGTLGGLKAWKGLTPREKRLASLSYRKQMARKGMKRK